MNSIKARIILGPSEAAERLGIPVAGLVAMIRRHRYTFTELAPGGRPGDRGRGRWGLTEAQLAAIVGGQARGYREPEAEAKAEAKAEKAKLSALSPDGKSRVRMGKTRL